MATSAERYCGEELFRHSHPASCDKAVPSRTIWRDRFGPPTLERSGSEHRRAVTSPLPEEEGLGEKVELSLQERRRGRKKKNSVTLYADWGDYFLHLSSIKDQEHFFGIMKRPCPTFVLIWQSEHPDNIFVMSANAGQTMGLGMDIENVDYRNLAPTSLPFHPLVEIGLRKFLDANNDLYLELNSHCPLKLRKDRLVAVWGQET